MSEHLTYGGVVSTQVASTIAGSARNALYVCSPKSSQCRGDRTKVAVAAVLSPGWHKTELPKKHTDCPVLRDERTRAGC
jgi:hypothetical protein